MVLLETKLDDLREQPIIKTRMWKSKNEEQFVVETTIRYIKPIQYVETILNSPAPHAEKADAL